MAKWGSGGKYDRSKRWSGAGTSSAVSSARMSEAHRALLPLPKIAFLGIKTLLFYRRFFTRTGMHKLYGTYSG